MDGIFDKISAHKNNGPGKTYKHKQVYVLLKNQNASLNYKDHDMVQETY